MSNVRAPEPFAVFQRGDDNTAAIPIHVDLPDGGVPPVRLQDAAGGEVSVALDVRNADGALRGHLNGVPVGGPYTLTVGEAETPGLLVGDLWLLGGQSNMEGCGKLVDVETPSDQVNAYYQDDHWARAEEPLHWLLDAVDPVHWHVTENREAIARWERSMRSIGSGLGLTFAKEIVAATGAPVGLVACAHGGTSMDQWSPSLKDEGGKSLYGATLRRVAKLGGRVKGMLWYQGESDANPPSVDDYAAKTESLVAALRKDLSAPDLAFLYVQIGCFYSWECPADDVACWDRVRSDQLALEAKLAPAGVATAIDLSLADAIHIDTAGLKRLGKRLARLAGVTTYGLGGSAGPRPGAIDVSADRRSLRLAILGVTGRLTEKCRVTGFSLWSGGAQLLIERCVVGADGSSIEIAVPDPLPVGAELWYGRGLNPPCGLVDEADLALPTFGPAVV